LENLGWLASAWELVESRTSVQEVHAEECMAEPKTVTVLAALVLLQIFPSHLCEIRGSTQSVPQDVASRTSWVLPPKVESMKVAPRDASYVEGPNCCCMDFWELS